MQAVGVHGLLRAPSGSHLANAVTSLAVVARIVTAVAEVLAAGRQLLLLTDYDGTLTPIVSAPVDAWLAREVRDDLQALATSGRVRVGIVSGRRVDDLRMRVRLAEVIYAGCHGLEIEGPEISFTHSEAAARREALAAIAEALHRRTAAMRGVVVEPKGLSVAVHYRHADPAAVGELEAVLAHVVDARAGLRALHGRQVVEILPTTGWDKGQGALRIRDHVRAGLATGLTTVYLGDDATDELAFRVLDDAAITVRVAGGPDSLAAHRLADVGDVHRLLAALAAEVGRGAAA
jgi:trehalose-phosphatase